MAPRFSPFHCSRTPGLGGAALSVAFGTLGVWIALLLASPWRHGRHGHGAMAKAGDFGRWIHVDALHFIINRKDWLFNFPSTFHQLSINFPSTFHPATHPKILPSTSSSTIPRKMWWVTEPSFFPRFGESLGPLGSPPGSRLRNQRWWPLHPPGQAWASELRREQGTGQRSIDYRYR